MLGPSSCTVPSRKISLISFLLFVLDVGSTAQMHIPHLDICDTVAHRGEMLCHRKPRIVLAYALQMLSKSTPEASPNFTDVETGVSAAGYAVHKIF